MEKTIETQRYYALDILRGMAIALMIPVSNLGSWSAIYPPLKHSAWHGFTPTDWLFHSFLFVVGTAMSFSLKKYEIVDNSLFLKKVGKRAEAILIYSIEILNFKKWGYFFGAFGKNPLFIFVVSGLVAKHMGLIHIDAISFKTPLYDLNASLGYAAASITIM
ncbi:MAG: heparan-alpha-glucosaminide N-acetyltransferase domain-containing protein [Flavobacteriaceae bacterium]